jgi:hypothetical protein
MLDKFLAPEDQGRAARTFNRFASHDISQLTLAGGFAIELRILERGGRTLLRPLHDIDFLAVSFDSIPNTLGSDFLFRHVHPDDPPGKTLLQAVDPASALRVDVFRAYGAAIERATPIDFASLVSPHAPYPSISPRLRVAAIEDLAARHARLCCDLFSQQTVQPKFARDLLRLLELLAPEQVEPAWQEHRKPTHPATFASAAEKLRTHITTNAHLLVAPTYSTDPSEFCARCRSTDFFPLTDAGSVLSLLGYC